MKSVLRCSFLSFSLLCLLQADVPGWFREVSSATHPTYPASTKGVSLFYEEIVRVEATGKQTSQIRKAIKILSRDGRREASGILTYDAKGSRVRDFKAWIIYPNGKTKEYTKKDFVEGMSHPEYTMYSTRRYYGVNAAADVDPGTVFGYESTLEEDTVFSQFIWPFQDDLPHLLSRFQLSLPPGWKAEARAYQGAKAEPELSGGNYTWESRKLNPIEREPGAPQLFSMLPRIAVSIVPPEGTPQTGGPVAFFRSWKDVARWQAELADPQAQVSAAIESKATQLSQGKSGPLEKIRAMAEYVQKIRYVSITTNSARGGGYTPHKADDVLRLAYGDCKDKANLLRTLLKTIQVASYPLVIYAGDPRFTKEDFPSPHQFNHAILAISVPEAVQAAAAFTHPKLGRLLIFDPTDAYVPFGFLPDHEQNSNALLTTANDAGEAGYLVKTPQTKAAENHCDRQWILQLGAEGDLQGELIETSTGQEAFDDRETFLRLPKDQFLKQLTTSFSRDMTGVVIDSMDSSYDEGAQRFRLMVRFHQPAYAKIMNGKLWMLRSMPLAYRQVPNVNLAKREQPLILRPLSFSEQVSWKLPEKLTLDELPRAERLEAVYGKYESNWTQNGTQIFANRRLEIQPSVLPIEKYLQAREFFHRFNGSGEAAIVLITK